MIFSRLITLQTALQCKNFLKTELQISFDAKTWNSTMNLQAYDAFESMNSRVG